MGPNSILMRLNDQQQEPSKVRELDDDLVWGSLCLKAAKCRDAVEDLEANLRLMKAQLACARIEAKLIVARRALDSAEAALEDIV